MRLKPMSLAACLAGCTLLVFLVVAVLAPFALVVYYAGRPKGPAPEVRTVYVHVPTASSVEPTPSRPISGSPGVVRRTGAPHGR